MVPAFTEYLIKLSICLGVVYIFYQLFLRRITFYKWNRWYLMGYSALSFFIPLFDIMPHLQKQQLDEASLIQWIPALNYAPGPAEQNLWQLLSYQDWILLLIGAGSLFFLVKFFIKLRSFLLMKKKATPLTKHQISLYQLDENITPFSFGNAIFINKHLHAEPELQEIIRHEFVHVKQKHTIDILFAEFLCITNWFNPFAWLVRRSIKQNLEFIADDKVVQSGFNKQDYQYLLLKVMGNKQFSITNHFNFSNLKKRIAMMNTFKTAKVHLIKFLFLLPVVAVLSLSFRKEMLKTTTTIPETFVKDTIPDNDSGYKISVIVTPGASDNPKMNRNVIDRMSLEDWNKNKEFYEKKYGQGVPAKTVINTKDGKEIKYDSVYVTKYKPKPIKPGEEPLIIVDGNEIPYSSMNSIPPDEIKSVSVMKDESFTSQYGEKGKNGVILIITHNGYRPQQHNWTDSLKGKVNGILISPDKFDSNDSLDKGFPKRTQVITMNGEEKPLTILDGEEISVEDSKGIKGETIKTINVLKGEPATAKYGEKGKNGVIELTSKKATTKGN